MARTLKTVLLLLMLVLVPVRALAAVTTGACAFAHHHGSEAPADAHDHSHDGKAPAHPEHSSGCDSCVEHCSSASFAVSAIRTPLLAALPAQRSVLQERFAAGFVPDHLDPPPLVL